jgi:hypothetical protein
MIDPILDTGLKAVCGICWTIAYLAMIRKGFAEKTYCMPAIALFLNFAWEATFAFIMPFVYGIDMGVQLPINIAWFLCDALIFCTYLLYGPKYFPKSIGKRRFLPLTGLGLAAALAFVLLMSLELSDFIGMYSAFIINLMMSVLFIDMLVKRGSAEGQSMSIAITKWIGTLAISVYFFLRFGSPLVLYLGAASCVFDLIYIALLNGTIKASKKKELPVTVKSSQ